jgi:hypothetical protein
LHINLTSEQREIDLTLAAYVLRLIHLFGVWII